jgi:hypothetical protein
VRRGQITPGGKSPLDVACALERRAPPSRESRLPRTERTDEHARATHKSETRNSERKVASSLAPTHVHPSHAAHRAGPPHAYP